MVLEFNGISPTLDPTAFVAPNATIIGDVKVAAGASVWFGAVLRGDQAPILIGVGSNVQDNVVIHCSKNLPTVLGRGVTVGHGALLEGCTIGDDAVVGMGAIMLQRSRLGCGAMLAAGSVMREGFSLPDGHLGAGVPAIDKGPLGRSAGRWVEMAAPHYQELAQRYHM